MIGKLLEPNDTNFSYDAQKNGFTDMVWAGIIDPVKVVLQDAAPIARLLIITQATAAGRVDEYEYPGAAY